MPRTYLDISGDFFERVSLTEVQNWEAEAVVGNGEQRTLAKVWLGEWQFGRNEDPTRARGYFKSAERESPSLGRDLAISDEAILDRRQGNYERSLNEIDQLRKRPKFVPELQMRLIALKQSAQLGKNTRDRNLKLGLPEPQGNLDPLCGRKSLAACLQRIAGKTYDLSKVCRATGLGSNLADLKVACDRLGIDSYLLSANPEGFKRLPKPLIAYVDHNHFVAVLDSDKNGLDVYCSECAGGGLRRVDWSQWRNFEPSAFLVPVQKAGRDQMLLASALSKNLRLPLHTKRARQGSKAFLAASSALKGAISALDLNVARYNGCTGKAVSSIANSHSNQAPDNDPINLATLTSSLGPTEDLTVKNPTGPSVQWGRIYNSLWNAIDSSEIYNAQDLFDFGRCWSHTYATVIVDPSATPVPQIVVGTPTQIYNQGSATLDPGYTWELYLNATKVQDNTSPGSWTITFSYGVPTVTPPSSYSSTTGYELVWSYSGTVESSQFDILSVNTIRKGIVGKVNVAASNAPGSGLVWEVREAGTTVASSSAGGGWVAGLAGTYFNVTAPETATLSSSYEIRYTVGGLNYSGTFTLAVGHAIQSSGSKCVMLADRSKVPFTAPSVPNATTTSVLCNTAPGYPYAIYWLYDANNPYGDYKLVSTDRSYMILAGTTQASGLGFETYLPVAQYDSVGNYIVFNYEFPGAYYNGMPMLASISQSSGSTLLTINRSSAAPNPITSVSDCYGRSIYYGIDSSNYLQSVSAVVPTGTTTPLVLETYTYNNSPYLIGMLTTVSRLSPTGSGMSTTTYNLTPDYEVSSTVDQEGNKRLYAYTTDMAHTIVTVENSAGTLVDQYEVGFNSNGSVTSMTDGSLSTIVYSAVYGDSNNPFQPSEVQDGDSRSWFYSYDHFGHLLTYKTPRPVTTTYTYSYANQAVGELTQVQEGTLPATSFTYYEPSSLLHTASGPTPDGSTGTSTFTYSTLGNLATSTTPGNATSASILTTYGYTTDGTYSQAEAIGEPITVTDNLGFISHFRYDSLGRPSSAWDPLGNTVSTYFNLADQPTQITYPATGQTGTSQSYSLTSYLWAGGPVSSSASYDESGHLVRSVNNTYGLCDELLTSTGTSDSVSYAYDAAFRPITVTNGNSGTTSYFYNPASYVSEVILPGGDTTYYNSYSHSGRLLQMTTPSGIVKNMTYGDPDGLLTAVSYPAYTSQNQSITYDGYGRTATTANGNASYGYTWGSADQLTQKTVTYSGLAAQTLTYSYNKDGSESNLATSIGNFTYSYDGDQRLTGVSNPFVEATGYNYLNNGWLNKRTLSNHAYTVLTHNALGEVSDVSNYSPSSTILSEFGSLVHDGSGALTSTTASIPAATSLNGTTSYTYDSLGQILSDVSTRAGGHTFSFHYDGNGNPTTFRSAPVTYNSKDQLSGTGFSFDADGNPTTYSSTATTTDAEDRITGFTGYNSVTYGPDGLRTSKTVSGTTTYYLNDGGVPILELSSTGHALAANTFGPDGLVSRNSGGASVFYQFDQSGSTAERLNASAGVLSVHAYDAFGHPLAGYTATDPYDGYGAQSGYYTDHETMLEMLGHRFYDPQKGRFLNRDPIGTAGGNNIYRYCSNSPSSYTDPSGFYNLGKTTWADIAEANPSWVAGADELADIVGVPKISTTLNLGVSFETYIDHPSACTHAGVMADLKCGISWVILGASLGGGEEAIQGEKVVEEVLESTGTELAAEIPTIEISSERFGEAAEHAADSQAAGQSNLLTVDRPMAEANRKANMRGRSKVLGKDWDEYPPAMFREGGLGASMRAIDRSSNRALGGYIGQRCRGIPDGGQAILKIVP